MHPFTRKAKALFSQHGNSENAHFMLKYMKFHFDFYGIKTKERKVLQDQLLKQYTLPDNDIEAIVHDLYGQDERELHHFALDILIYKLNKVQLDWVVLFEYLLIRNSWWDTVDCISTRLVGKYFMTSDLLLLETHSKWINSKNIWLQRAAILFQLKYKSKTDEKLLFNAVLHCRNSNEFFIQKAIGWALREYSRTNRNAVIDFLNENHVSTLSKREALKLVKKQDKIDCN